MIQPETRFTAEITPSYLRKVLTIEPGLKALIVTFAAPQGADSIHQAAITRQ